MTPTTLRITLRTLLLAIGILGMLVLPALAVYIEATKPHR